MSKPFAAAFATLFLAGVPVMAQTPPAAASRDCQGGIDLARAAEIGREAGVTQVRKVECDDGKWEVEGRDAQGREIEVDIDPRDGRVLKTDRD
ncbi:PepSY domain-containing protein [Falsiroseomonas sp. HC035]|uniref:PepSY domain-containing protein n=1 Tax=Falsiroseomonas sp. HC035 TaxID=3390999 RepID=UPI003D316A7A